MGYFIGENIHLVRIDDQVWYLCQIKHRYSDQNLGAYFQVSDYFSFETSF